MGEALEDLPLFTVGKDDLGDLLTIERSVLFERLLAEVGDDVRAELDLSGVTELVGQNSYFERLEDVLAAFEQKDAVNE